MDCPLKNNTLSGQKFVLLESHKRSLFCSPFRNKNILLTRTGMSNVKRNGYCVETKVLITDMAFVCFEVLAL